VSGRTGLPAWVGPVLRALSRRPDLWPVAAVTALRLAPPGWWRRRPYLPLPDPGYWRLRMTIAYGGAGDGPPHPEDVVSYLQWCRGSWRRSWRGLG
jgi:hypothetical protein